ncbi:DUF2306 domain-containing protein [Auritidibacter sp. NML100628]|uniref:DUF2306 domain-containing protein n=1 Tax=Auritidibacter sp. NML100628 TaxID=2170742 RepID=UPI0011B22557|nr:DUF2306 domain-containing protein [Auritidibacter sp. NML100628]
METIPLAVVVHASAAFLVLIIGPINIFRPRRDAVHRVLGRTWVGLMYLTCVSSFFFGLDDGFTFLHGLSVFTTVSVTLGVWMTARGNTRGHIGNMVGSYVGTLIAFGFAAFVPTRLIWTTAVTNPVALTAFAAALALIAGAWFAVLKARLGGGDGPKSKKRGIAEGASPPVG